ncbi:hypothetical protein CDO51_12800 [Natranaerobius trueperi]|uniref:Uncharacterized protein n=2 Tax=Natranaerobius trueperi TaxID=759412 RepID=A0A226BUM4_9FIRM|nr:hypothetical protein CDO51_12800 [Natranaerobius trueperi]
MISQDELASKYQSSRSTIAGHIRNLKKKGYILGKKYLMVCHAQKTMKQP